MNKRVQDTMYARASVYRVSRTKRVLAHKLYVEAYVCRFRVYSRREIKVFAHANAERLRESIAPLFMPIGNR